MRALAFVDLDLTLFDYTSARRQATLAALGALGVERHAEKVYDFAERRVIPYGHLLADLGFPDFRRAWKAPEFFAFLAALSGSRSFRRDASLIRGYLADIEAPRDSEDEPPDNFGDRYRHYLRLARTFHGTVLSARLAEARLRLREDGFGRRVRSAVEAFDGCFRGKVFLRDGVDELFASLRGQGFEVYIVSEGDARIQRDKIRVLGLDRPVDGVFVSGSCGQSERLLGWLWGRALDRAGDSAARERKAIGVLYNEVLGYSLKSPLLYRKTAHAILTPPRERVRFFAGFGWLGAAACARHEPVRILACGDRYDKDLWPAMRAFGEVLSIRLHAGKYRNAYSGPKLVRCRFPAPAVEVFSLAEAAAFIRSYGASGVPGVLPAPREQQSRIRRVGRALEILGRSAGFESTEELDLLSRLPAAMRGSE